MTAGTFNVARTIWDHAVFRAGEFSEREAFLWLVSEAAWRPRTVRVAGHVAECRRGQLCASVRFMAGAWGWSKSRVSRFLSKLRDHNMIENRDSSGTAPMVITVCNYEKFQGQRDRGDEKPGQQRDSSGTNEKKVIREEVREIDTDVSISCATKPAKAPRKAAADAPADPAFDAFWSAYPRKIAKGAARRAWAGAARKADPPDIIAAACLVQDRGRYTPHPATWLNAERWNDQPEPQHVEPPQHPRRAAGSGQALIDAAARVGARYATPRGD